MSGLLARKVAVVYGGGGAIGGAVARVFARGGRGIRTVCLRPDALPDAVALSGAREVFEGVSKRIGIPVHEMLNERARSATLLGRLPKLAEVAEFAAFAASGRAGAMTGAIANLTCGSLTD
jgi:NAD(P)-dependent dehydrogenase (short-subunit alcohol dehydrogenase family)